MSDICETVMVKSDEMGAVRINASDFDPSMHKLVDDDAPKSHDDLGTDSGDQFSDDQLRAIIEQATGKAPHHKTGRDKLVATFNELNKDA